MDGRVGETTYIEDPIQTGMMERAAVDKCYDK